MAKTLPTEVITKILKALPGCQTADCKSDRCLRCAARGALLGGPGGDDAAIPVIVGAILSNRTKQGMVEMIVGDVRVQMPLDKAREVYGFLGGAIEAATTDQIVFGMLREMGLSEQKVAMFVADMRERRQGSKGTVFAS